MKSPNNTSAMKEKENPSKSSGGTINGTPIYGAVHPTLQQYDCHATDVESLLSLLPPNKCPLSSWCPKNTIGTDDDTDSDGPKYRYDIDPGDVRSWFPKDDLVVLYAPPPNDEEGVATQQRSEQYCTLTYRQLHEEIGGSNPLWRPPVIVPNSSSLTLEASTGKTADDDRPFVVAVLLPPEMMAEMAVVLLSVMAAPAVRDGVVRRRICAAPLDPHLAAHRILEAMKQLRCEGLVSTEDFLRKVGIWEALQGADMAKGAVKEEEGLLRAALDRLREVRIAKSNNLQTGLAGAVEWTIFQKQLPMSGKGLTEWAKIDPASYVYGISQPEAKRNGESINVGGAQQPILMLRTSGTTATPKVVPLTPNMILFNAISIASSLDLQRADIDLNAMPLHHIGGIACALLSVLVSGSGVIMAGPFVPGSFLDQLQSLEAGDDNMAGNRPIPTWYYGVPTMHKSVVLTAQARLGLHSTDGPERSIPTKLRFIRSGASHLSHTLALDLSRIFRTDVIPTYSMSECMPVCSSSTPIHFDTPYDEALIDTVGPPIGPSVRIIDNNGRVVPQGRGLYGEVALRGPGVVQNYKGVPRNETHTTDGWLKTGDVGYMDDCGKVWLNGRTKEMIKRGGEQIWPCLVDDLLLRKVNGISTAVTFGVPNELWGEEVAIAVVLDPNLYDTSEEDEQEIQSAMRKDMIAACQEELDDTSVPRQIIFVEPEDLPKGPTGKYLRTKMASHLGVSAVDTGALTILEGASAAAERQQPSQQQVPPSKALNGLRFITACFVVHLHVGLFPNNAWVKIQSFTFNMSIFFILGAFQLACSVNAFVDKKWARFVGTKIGAMHALFLIAQIIALPSYLIFACDGGNAACDSNFYTRVILVWVFATLTGLLGAPNQKGVYNVSNALTWFQTTFYLFLMAFPLLDKSLRTKSSCIQWFLLIVFGILASCIVIIVVSSPSPRAFMLNFTIVTWLPALVCAMISGYIFRRAAVSASSSNTGFCGFCACRPKVWGYVADLLSIVILVIEVLVALSDNCIYVRALNYLSMRPGEPLPDETTQDAYGQIYVRACDVSYDEYKNFIHNDPYDALNLGRWTTDVGEALGSRRLGTPIILLWIFALAFGRGVTARVLGSRPLTVLAPLAYPVYLLHAPVTRFYWVATRGLQREFWWFYEFVYPYPVAWWEFLVILVISIVLGVIIDAFFIPRLMPHTLKWGVNICSSLSRCIRCKRRETEPLDPSSGDGMEPSTFSQIECMVTDLTGATDVTRSASLRNLGLDSLGATALLATLKVSVQAAEKLTMADLSQMETVGDLVDFLDIDLEDESIVADDVV